MSILHRRSKSNICEYFVIVGFDFSSTVDHHPNNEFYDSHGEDARQHSIVESVQWNDSGPNDPSTLFTIEPGILDQYPYTIPNKLPEGIEYFCFPNGIKVSLRAKHPTFHSFVHTSEDGSRMIGSVLVFSEELEEDQYGFLERQGVLTSGEYGLDELNQKKKLFIQKGICLLSRYPFITAFKSFLKTLYKLSKASSNSIPLERYICNFIDDVPAPPLGKVDITYFIDEVSITFRCPPSNEPNSWSGFPLFPLFECLDIDNICHLLALLLVERQVLLVSSQYSLLTLCAEAMTSLLYPIRWIHAYIPILPSGLLGALGAPFPFIFGVSTETYQRNSNLVSNETVKVFLDDNKIDFGELGPPPPLPERRHMKLKNQIGEIVPWYLNSELYAKEDAIGDSTDEDSKLRRSWKKYRLMRFDMAASDAADIPMPRLFPTSISSGASTPSSANSTNNNSNSKERYILEDGKIREGFLKFFVAILKDYKRFLVYHTKEEMAPSVNFRFEDFIHAQPVEWQGFLREIVKTQAFSQFIDERVVLTKLDRDVIFFDESIDAKSNRYTFRLHDIDTPFLLHNSDKHVKTYVPPSPQINDIPKNSLFSYSRFPVKLNERWILPPRNLAASFSSDNVRLLSLLNKVRLKRKIIGSQKSYVLSAAACIYSSYLVSLAQFISRSVDIISRGKNKNTTSLSTTKLLNEYNVMEGRGRSNSIARSDGAGEVEFSYSTHQIEEVHSAANLALKVAFEVINCLSRLDYAPDEIVYRCMAEACADLKQTNSLIDLIVYMDDEGLIADHQIRHALLRCLTSEQSSQDNNNTERYSSFSSSVKVGKDSADSSNANSSSQKVQIERNHLQPAEVWTFQNWKSMKRENGLLIMRSSVGQQVGGTVRGGEVESSLAKFLFGYSNTATAVGNEQTRKSMPQLRDRWSVNVMEGFVPNLKWDNNKKESNANSVTFSASNKLRRQVTLGEEKLQKEFPGLIIDLNNEYGTKCPNDACPSQRCLTIGEIYQGWSSNAGDLNKYTTKCVHCEKEFIPRLKLSSSSVDTESSIWMELLSPWVLHKELVNVVLEDGISTLLSRRFRCDEQSTLFWNSLIAFRLRGLPISFLLTNGSITEAFPPK